MTTSKAKAPEAAEDAMALAGLRRLVIHAKTMLASSKGNLPAGDFAYDAHWRPGKIREQMAITLAIEVLQLVADCLPAEGDR